MFDKQVYISRRKRLLEKVKGGVILLLGNSEASCNYFDNQYQFRQDSSFLYFFGLDKPDLAAVLDTESGEEILFGDDVDINDIIWMGPQPLISEEAASTGVSKSAPFDSSQFGTSNALPCTVRDFAIIVAMPPVYSVLVMPPLALPFSTL